MDSNMPNQILLGAIRIPRLQVEERFLESLPDNVFGVFPNPRVAERKRKDFSLVAPKKGLKRQLKRVNLSPVHVRQEILICLDCGYTEIVIPELQLKQLRKGMEAYRSKGAG